MTTFLIAYTLSQALSGKVLDRIGTRAGFMLFVGIWITASMLHSIAANLVMLAAFRFMLGIGEAGNWPGAAKSVAEWFPVRERAFAMAIFNSGASIGAVIAPPLIVYVALNYGWRSAFFIGASLASVVMVLWYLFYRTPAAHPRLSEEERQHIFSDQPPAAGRAAALVAFTVQVSPGAGAGGRALLHRPDLVVLDFLATQLPEERARFQPRVDRTVRLDPVSLRRHW